jgi:hypothetical protein
MERRAFLKMAPAAAAAISMPAAAIALPCPPQQAEMTAAERMAHHLEEYKKAAQEVDPRIYGWNVYEHMDPSSTMACAAVIAAFRWLGDFDGDGWYLIRFGDQSEAEPHHVARSPAHDQKAERWFRLDPANGKPFYTEEKTLKTWLAAKLPGSSYP